jgi:hypothetical protein
MLICELKPSTSQHVQCAVYALITKFPPTLEIYISSKTSNQVFEDIR